MMGVLRLNQSEASTGGTWPIRGQGSNSRQQQSINTSPHWADNTLLWTIEAGSKKSAACQNLASIEIVNIKL